MIGQVFGRLTVLERSTTRDRRAQWLCVCTCGGRKIVSGQHLRRTGGKSQNGVKSCGCLRTEIVIAARRAQVASMAR